MTEITKQYSQIFDDGIKSGIIPQIGERVFLLLIGLAPFINENGECNPKEGTLARIFNKTERTISTWVSIAKKTTYRGQPVITARQNKEIDKGQIIWSSNQYSISKPILEDLLTRYYTGGRNLPTDKEQIKQGKTLLPPEVFPSSEELPTNDNPSVNNIYNNDKRQSLIKIFSFNGTTPSEFRDQAQSGDDFRCSEIAEWLGEKHINFILSARKNPQCGMNGIEECFSITKDAERQGKVRDKRRYFNDQIKRYTERR
ncbi:MAG: hypothetical protein HYT61_02830 [Candidatus Yanofskybacteria bacterium]|nr:hypothetical protein [Candidatus Yanofskybacteria bacterium]